jgi:IS30 family transposase
MSRALSRNTGKRAYRHQQADRFAGEWHQQKNKHIKLSTEVIDYLSEQLKIYWSPEQIVGRLTLDENIKISRRVSGQVE